MALLSLGYGGGIGGTIALIAGIYLGHVGKRLMNIGMGGAVKIGKWKF